MLDLDSERNVVAHHTLRNETDDHLRKTQGAHQACTHCRLLELIQISVSWLSHVWLPSMIWILSKWYKHSIRLWLGCIYNLLYKVHILGCDTDILHTLTLSVLKLSDEILHMSTKKHTQPHAQACHSQSPTPSLSPLSHDFYWCRVEWVRKKRSS